MTNSWRFRLIEAGTRTDERGHRGARCDGRRRGARSRCPRKPSDRYQAGVRPLRAPLINSCRFSLLQTEQLALGCGELSIVKNASLMQISESGNLIIQPRTC